jgi:hypothetical protein
MNRLKLASLFLLTCAPTLLAQAVRTGFTTVGTLPAVDDDYTGPVNTGFSTNFFGNTFTNLYISTNGYITFGSGQSTFTPQGLQGNLSRIIAPFFADVDNRGAGSITYGTGTVNGFQAFSVTWSGVGFYNVGTSRRNTFQLVLINRADTGAGNFDIEFNYDSIQWEAGDVDNGSGGLCLVAATGCGPAVGYSNGASGVSNVSFELPGSHVRGAFLDGAPGALRTVQAGGSGVPGRQIYPVRNGSVVVPATVTVSGSFTYLDKSYSGNSGFTGTLARPVRFATYKVLATGGATLFQGTTSSTGTYSALVPGLASGQQFQVQVLAESAAARVVGSTGNTTYNHLANGTANSTSVNLGAEPVSNPGAFNILDVSIEAFQYIDTSLGRQIPQVVQHWSPGSTNGTYYQGGNIFLLGGSDPDEYDDDVILHEYGHHVAASIGTVSQFATGNHSFAGVSHKDLAFSEGFANYISGAVRGNGTYCDTNGTTCSIFNSYEGPTPFGTTQFVEAAVTAALWDAKDPQNESFDFYAGGDAAVLQVLDSMDAPAYVNDMDVIDFFDRWGVTRSDRAQFNGILAYYVIIQGDSTAPVVSHSPSTTATAGQPIVISASAVDSLGAGTGIGSVVLFYRTGTAGAFTAVVMSQSGSTFTGTIPGPAVTTSGVQYYIEARDLSFNWRRWPDTLSVPPTTFTVSVSGSGGGGGSSARAGIFRAGFFWLEDVDGNRQFTAPPDRAFAFGGLAGDIPITGDWSGTGTTKVGVYRSAHGTFLLDYDGDGQFTSADRLYDLGVGTQPNDVPVIGDWNGDGRSKVGIFRAGFFWILDNNGNGAFQQGVDQAFAFGGVAGDVPVVGDWDGNGRSDVGLFRLGFYWILDYNGNGTIDNINNAGGDKAFPFGGLGNDVPIVGDWNGDGRSKPGVFRAGFFWVIDQNGDYQFTGTGAGQDAAFAFGGLPNDRPVIGKW